MTHNYIETASTAAQEFCDEGLAALAEAKEHRAAAAADRAAAELERGAARHDLATARSIESGFSRREAKLHELREGDLLAREKAVDEKAAEVQAMLASYSASREGAARALIEINAREEAAREEREAARRQAAAA
jgi:hypothetical protein